MVNDHFENQQSGRPARFSSYAPEVLHLVCIHATGERKRLHAGWDDVYGPVGVHSLTARMLGNKASDSGGEKLKHDEVGSRAPTVPLVMGSHAPRL